MPADVAVQHAAHRLADGAVSRFVARRARCLRLVHAGLGLGEIDGMHPHHPARDFTTLPARQVEHGGELLVDGGAARDEVHVPYPDARGLQREREQPLTIVRLLLGEIPLPDHLREELERDGDENEERLNGEGVLVLRDVGERPVAVHRADRSRAA